MTSKILVSVLFLCGIAACSTNTEVKQVEDIVKPCQQSYLVDSLIGELKQEQVWISQLKYENRELYNENHLLKDSLIIQNWKVNLVKHYVKIVESKPYNLKFLVGWINNQCLK